MMEHILFVNACMRGREESRTWELSRAFLAACQTRWPKAEIVERDLTVCDLPMLTGPRTLERDRRFQTDPWDPMFAPAHEMQGADLIVVSAPYWDLSFPAALKIYLEWSSVLGITFHYTLEGKQEGLCKAGNLVYITTAGGEIGDQNLGYDYVRALSTMFGISRTHCLAADGLDLWDNDAQAILNRAKKQAEKLAASL